jgi:hypothetical protein
MPGAKQLGIVALVECDPHRHALHDFHPVAGRVLRRQDRKLCTSSRAYRDDRSGKGAIGETVDIDCRFLADTQIGDVGFLRICVDPRRLIVDHTQHRGAGRDEAAELDVIHLRGRAGHWRADDRVIEVALRVVEHRLRLGIFRKLFQRQVGIAEQLSQCRIALLDSEFSLAALR